MQLKMMNIISFHYLPLHMISWEREKRKIKSLVWWQQRLPQQRKQLVPLRRRPMRQRRKRRGHYVHFKHLGSWEITLEEEEEEEKKEKEERNNPYLIFIFRVTRRREVGVLIWRSRLSRPR